MESFAGILMRLGREDLVEGRCASLLESDLLVQASEEEEQEEAEAKGINGGVAEKGLRFANG